MYKIGFVSVIFCLTAFLSCSDSSTDPGDTDKDTGEGSFIVSGNLEEQHKGAAYFTLTKLNGNLVGIRIHVVESHPRDRDDSYEPLYSLLLMADIGGESFSLSSGTYEVGQLTDDDLKFAGLYTQDGIGYHTRNHGGTFTISSVSDQWIEATFEFTAEGEAVDGSDDGGIISVSGEFSAECFGVTC